MEDLTEEELQNSLDWFDYDNCVAGAFDFGTTRRFMTEILPLHKTGETMRTGNWVLCISRDSEPRARSAGQDGLLRPAKTAPACLW